MEVEFSPKTNLFYGSNAQGKTNLLEAIFLMSTGRSFRTHHLSECIREKEPFFFVEAEFEKDGVLQTIKLSFDGQTKKMEHNQTTYAHFTNLLGLLPTVLIAPEDVQLITGMPAERRRFLDLHLAQIDPLYVHYLTRYLKAMKQRNFLLRHKKTDAIESWEQIMIAASRYVQERRKGMVEELQKLIRGDDALEIGYLPSIVEDYKKTRPKEVFLATTLGGLHRDDLKITIGGKEAKQFASQGQKRCAVTALRLAQWHHFYQLNEAAPILSIDDFGVHLDTERSRLLLEEIQELGQVFLTSTARFPLERIFKVVLDTPLQEETSLVP
jgi:DNA replication and repair protein RecF